MKLHYDIRIVRKNRILSSAIILITFVFLAIPGNSVAQTASSPVSPDLLALQAEHQNRQLLVAQPNVDRLADSLPVTDGFVVIDAASENPQALLRNLQSLGLRNGAVYGYMVSGLLPITSISDMEQIGGLRFARPAYASAGTGSVDSQGDASMNTDDVRAQFGIDGTGITIGTMSDTYNCLGGAPADVLSNDLPAGVVILSDPVMAGCIDEGRAMMQIVHDVAPGVLQGFHTAFVGQADFALGIEELAGCPAPLTPGCTVSGTFAADVVNDDVFYFAEPFFQDGIISQAVDKVVNSGVSYFTLAGNHGRESYQAPFSSSGVAGGLGGTLHDFDPGAGVDVSQRITIPVNRRVTFSFQWVDQYFAVSGAPGAASNLDIVIRDVTGNLLASGTAGNIGGDPIEVFNYLNNGAVDVDGTPGPDSQFDIQIELRSGPAPVLIKYIALVNGGIGNFTQNEWDTQSSTIYGHMNTALGETVGAAAYFNTPAFGVNPPVKEPFSSAGPTPIYFDLAGNLIAPVIRNKPDITAPHRGNNTFFGSDSDMDGFPNFSGTSAATPHAAGAATLLLEAAGGPGSLTPAAVFAALESTAIDMDDPVTPGFDVGFDFGTGVGLINALTAIDPYFPEIAVDIESQSVQYSDAIAAVTITAADEADLTLVTKWTSNGILQISPLPPTLEVVPVAGACAPATSGVECVWTLQGQMLRPDSDIEVFVSVTNGFGNSMEDTTGIDVNVEDAVVAFDPSNPVSVVVSSAGGTSVPFAIVVDVTEFDDPLGLAGNISNAVVSATLSPVGPGSPVNVVCSEVKLPGVSDAGGSADNYDILRSTCSFDNVAVNIYSVDVKVNGDGYYAGEGEDVLVIYDPSLGFTTGGGWFDWPGTNERTNYGFNIKYNKGKGKGNDKAPQVQGSLLMIRHVDDVSHYRIKSNALSGLAVGSSSDVDGDFDWATFLGKSTYRDLTGINEGNHEFLAYVEDRGEPGTGTDRFWIQIRDKEDVVIPVISMALEAIDNAVVIQGGNISVPHKGKGPKKGNETATSVAELPTEFGLDQNYPNPFATSTNVRLQLPEARHVRVAVYDLMGREVGRLVDADLPAGYHDINWDGAGLGSGIYFYRMTAGEYSESRRMTLLK